MLLILIFLLPSSDIFLLSIWRSYQVVIAPDVIVSKLLKKKKQKVRIGRGFQAGPQSLIALTVALIALNSSHPGAFLILPCSLRFPPFIPPPKKNPLTNNHSSQQALPSAKSYSGDIATIAQHTAKVRQNSSPPPCHSQQ